MMEWELYKTLNRNFFRNFSFQPQLGRMISHQRAFGKNDKKFLIFGKQTNSFRPKLFVMASRFSYKWKTLHLLSAHSLFINFWMTIGEIWTSILMQSQLSGVSSQFWKILRRIYILNNCVEKSVLQRILLRIVNDFALNFPRKQMRILMIFYSNLFGLWSQLEGASASWLTSGSKNILCRTRIKIEQVKKAKRGCSENLGGYN